MTFPQALITFTTRRDVKDTIFAEHVNTIQAELTATQAVIGTDVLNSGWTGTFTKNASWPTIADRISNLESFAGAPAGYVSLDGGSVVQATRDVPGITIKHNGYSAQPLLEFLSPAGGSLAFVGVDGAITARRARTKPDTSDIGVEIAGASTYVGRPVVGSKADATVWFIDHLGGLTHSTGSFTSTGLVISPTTNVETLRINTTATQTLPLVTLNKSNVTSLQVGPTGTVALGGALNASRLLLDPTNTQILFRSSQTRSFDARINVSGGSESAYGDMEVIANKITIGTDSSKVQIRGAVDMPGMRSVFWTYVPPGGGDDDLYMPQNTTAWSRPENFLGEAITAGTSFIAPSSGTVCINVYARIQSESAPTALSYSLYPGSSPNSAEANVLLNPSTNWSVFLNGTTGTPPNNITSASLMSMRRITGLVPGSSYAMRLYFRNENTGTTKWQNKNGEYCLMLRQVGIMVIPEL